METHDPPQTHPPVPRTRVLKLQRNCCTGCIGKVKRAMRKIEGVHSIKVNANEGTIEVKSDIDPPVLIAMATKACKRAHLLWEPESEPESSSQNTLPRIATSSPDLTSQPQFYTSNSDQTINLQDLIDKNVRVVKDMKIIDKKVVKITFNDSPSPIPPPSSTSNDSKNGCGGGQTSGSNNAEAVLAHPAAVEPLASIPPQPEIRIAPVEPLTKIKDAPMEGTKDVPVANVNCRNGRYTSCRVM